MQNNSFQNGSMIEPSRQSTNFAPAAPGTAPTKTGTPVTSQHLAVPGGSRFGRGGIIAIVIAVLMTIVAVVFIALFVRQYGEYKAVSTDVDIQIDAAVARAVADNTSRMEAEFLEREKYPYRNFMGPADYGSLSFEYPQTWSVYVAKDAAKGGDYEAYLNPSVVEPVSNTTINALRVIIRDTAFDSAVSAFDTLVKNGKLNFSTRNVGGVMANIYTGEFSGGIVGIAAVFKLRDKTVILRTDAEEFASEYYRLLDTVQMIQ